MKSLSKELIRKNFYFRPCTSSRTSSGTSSPVAAGGGAADPAATATPCGEDGGGRGRDVPVLPWAVDGSSRRDALAGGKPVVFAGCPAADWPIVARVRRPEDLAPLLPPRVTVFEAATPSVLYYTSPVPLDQQAGGNPRRPANPKRAAARAELVRSLRRGTGDGGAHLYHSELVGEATRAVLGDATPLVVVEEAAAGPAGFRPSARVNLWAGAAGIHARVHYDTYHNFYLQVLGRKRFRLLLPDA